MSKIVKIKTGWKLFSVCVCVRYIYIYIYIYDNIETESTEEFFNIIKHLGNNDTSLQSLKCFLNKIPYFLQSKYLSLFLQYT